MWRVRLRNPRTRLLATTPPPPSPERHLHRRRHIPPTHRIAASVSMEARIPSAYIERALRRRMENSASPHAAYVHRDVENRVEGDEAGIDTVAVDSITASVLAAYYRTHTSERSSAVEMRRELGSRLRRARMSAENSANSRTNSHSLVPR